MAKLETINLGSVTPVDEKGVNTVTVLAVTSKQTLLTGANEEVVTVDGVYDLEIGQQLIISQADAPGVYHVVGLVSAPKAKSTTASSRAGACIEKEMPSL